MTLDSDSPSEEFPDVPREAVEVARRALILSAVVACAHGADKRSTIAWLESENLWADVSPAERTFLSGQPAAQEQIDMTWRMEALVPLLWVLRKVNPMPSVSHQFDSTEAVKSLVFPPASSASFIASATLRPEAEIRDEYERVYDAHWRLRDAQLFGKPLPCDVNPSVVRERHHALNWIVGYCNQTWDEITTDT